VISSLGQEVGRDIVADSDSEAATSSVPSVRQNFSVSSISTRLHWGQRFIFVTQADELAIFPANGQATTCKLTACTTAATRRA
jgi:hypothetical protein